MKHLHFNPWQEGGDPVRSVDEMAADWLARRIGGLSEAEELELSQWLAADVRHAETFSELEQTWHSLDGLQIGGPDRVSHPETGLRAGNATWRRLRAGTAVALATAAAVVLVFLIRPTNHNAGVDIALEVTTGDQGFRKVDLPDGSVVRVNAESEVKFRYLASVRRVMLERGEASFTVAHDSSRPFIVRAHGVDVRAVGTEFNVRAHAEALEVLVTEGWVSVNEAESGRSLLSLKTSNDTNVLGAGHRLVAQMIAAPGDPLGAAVIAADVSVVDVSPDEVHRELAWQLRQLSFESVPLSEIAAEFNRFNQHKLVIANPVLGARRFGGTFAADNSEAFVRLLEARFGVKAQRRANETVLR